MATNYVQTGDIHNFTNAGSAISSGDVVVVGQRLGVALVDIAATTGTGAVQMVGVFDNIPKVTAAVIADGESLTWDVSAGKFDDNAATPATGDVTVAPAVAVGAFTSSDTTMTVMFTGVPGTVT